MPSKKLDSYDVHDQIYETEEDLFSVDLDEDGNPYITPDLHNLGCDHTKEKWVDSVNEDIVALYKLITDYVQNHSCGHMLEKITFNRFLQFVANNSYQIS